MLDADLPMSMDLQSIYILDIEVPAVIEPNVRSLSESTSAPSRQSETSKKRRQFITGVGVHRISHAEIQARREYLDEWYVRASSNE